MKTTLLSLLCLISLSLLVCAGCNTATPAAALPVTPAGGSSSGVDPVVLPTAAPSQALPSPEPSRKASQAASPEPEKTTTAPTAVISPAPATTPALPSGPDGWKKLPVIPVVSDAVLEIYQRGQELGNNPHAFSKIGDCGSTPAWFLGDFDRGPSYYRLGKYQNLDEVIQQFHGSFERTSLAARSGFNASALFVPMWADRSCVRSR